MTRKSTPFLAAVATACVLAACSGQQETSVQLSASEAAASTPAAQTQTLESRDGKLSIAVDNSRFEDRTAEAAQWLGETEQGELVLLQRDEQRGITLAAYRLGAPKTDAAAYFQKLTDTLKTQDNIQDVTVGAATANRMNYRLSHGSDDIILQEHCVALYTPEQLYSVCASSDMATTAQLAIVLNNITVRP